MARIRELEERLAEAEETLRALRDGEVDAIIAAGLVGGLVAELPPGAQAGLAARLLTGSYYGNTVQIWSALVMSALLGLLLTGVVAAVEHLLLRQRRQA